MKITDFGATALGEKAALYTITNKNNMEISVTDLGATLVSIIVEDRDQHPCDVVLGYDEAAGYEAGDIFFGAIVGRCANRIGGATFTLNGKRYELTQNDNRNNLHSGTDFYNKRLWKVKEFKEDHIIFELESPHMDQGYPGNLCMEVTYTLTDENEVKIDYKGTTDEDTIVNMTNHSYFNLNGHASGDILDQKVWVDADAFTRTDKESIPTGELIKVEGTPMDFREMKTLGRDIEADYEALNYGAGYDHNYVLNNEGKLKKVAEMCAEESGIRMEVYTDLPGMQLYTGNFISDSRGKDHVMYHRRQGVCFETQYFPDAVNKENFKSPVLHKGDTYRSTTIYKFV